MERRSFFGGLLVGIGGFLERVRRAAANEPMRDLPPRSITHIITPEQILELIRGNTVEFSPPDGPNIILEPKVQPQRIRMPIEAVGQDWDGTFKPLGKL